MTDGHRDVGLGGGGRGRVGDDTGLEGPTGRPQRSREEAGRRQRVPGGGRDQADEVGLPACSAGRSAVDIYRSSVAVS
ncbi:MAG: hypothetical protein ABEJ05_11375 [Haloglomus sp.]